MSEREIELISMALRDSDAFPRARAYRIAAYFDNLKDFFGASETEMENMKNIKGERILSREDIQKIIAIRAKRLISPDKSFAENYISLVAREFTSRQIKNLRGLSLESFNTNPFLIVSLNLSTPEDVTRFNVYNAATRSIVTSFGNALEYLLLGTSEELGKGRDGWDIVREDKQGKKEWFQIKSGNNDMDADQIRYWTRKIVEVERKGERGYIGMAYGKKDDKTVTMGLLKQYLPDWEARTLIGRDLWSRLSGNPAMHTQVIDILRESAVDVLNGKSMLSELEDCVFRITKEFIEKYGDGEEGVRKYINDLF
ncbi:MAG: PmeII family type II restriction endonuclease [Candidatus Parvarchaeota archaeon]